MTTKTISPTLQNQLDLADPDAVSDILRQVHLGTILTPLKRTFTGLTAAGTFDLTAIDGTGETAGTTNPNRLPLLALRSLRVTAATTASTVGAYGLTDSGGTAVTAATHTVMGICLISDDGKTITFPTADVTAFVIEYVPQSYTLMTTVEGGLGGAP